MNLLRHSILALLRLNTLEGPRRAAWTRQLTEGELSKAKQEVRKGVPTYVLGHHDRLIARGKASIAVVAHGVCSSCHMKLPSGHQRRKNRDMDVCDHCGVFLVWENESEILPPTASAAPSNLPAGSAAVRRSRKASSK